MIRRTLRSMVDRAQVYDFMIPKVTDELDLSHGTILYLEGITVSFDGFKAIDDLNLYIDAGELRCIIGPNGAGKTTMMDVVTGKTRPDAGSAWFGQRMDLLRMSEAEIAEAGIGRKFQKPTVFECHSVFENLELAMSSNKNDHIDEVLEVIGLSEQIKADAGVLSHGQKQWLEIGMLLMQKPELLLVDEPVAGMTHQEMDRTAELLITLAGEQSVIVVEHDMDFVRALESPVTVLHQGHVLAEGSMEDVQNNQRVIDVYLGGH